ncbi:MAG: branched-chain amino acid ABC transporter permease [Nitrospinota bacterium]
MRKHLLLVAILTTLCVYPFAVGPYFVSMGLLIFMYIAMSAGWNLISGYTGYVSLGHAVFFGVGAYAGALLISRAGLHWLPAAIAGGAVAVFLAVPVGILCLRLRGPYFAIFMLGLNELMSIFASIFEDFTGGAEGISLPLVTHIIPIYFGMAALALTAIGVTFWLDSSRFGLRLLSIREDEIAADTLGTDTSRYKLLAFLLSAFFPGAAGAMYAWYISYIDPETVFDILFSIQMVIMCILGGRGTPLGPVIGVVTLYLISELTWANFPHFHQFISGILIVLILLFAPRGIIGFLVEKGRMKLRPRFREKRGFKTKIPKSGSM